MSNFLGIVLILFSLCKLLTLSTIKTSNFIDKIPNEISDENNINKLPKIIIPVVVFDIALGITCGCIILFSL